MNSRHSIGAGLVVVSFVVLGALARPALAGEGKVGDSKASESKASESKKAQAEVHYDQGKAYYRAGAFDLAIQEFLEGYELDPRAGVLFNIARGYEELKNRDKAIEFYKKYIGLGAQAAAATEARARLVVLERQIKDEDERKKADAAEAERKRQEALNPPPPTTPTPVPSSTTPMPAPVETKVPGATPSEMVAAPGATPAGLVAAPAPAPSDPELAHKLEVAGIVTGGAGVVLVGVGGFFAWRASSIKSDIAKEKTYSPGKDSDYKSASMLGVVGLAAGGVAIAGGAVLYYLGWSKAPHDGATPAATTAFLAPSMGPDGATLLLNGSF
ncbi:MAG: TonB-dependent receptor [Myxococcales bacterium]|nr:TonB-dependent receptor [Myxococcales bacterium]